MGFTRPPHPLHWALGSGAVLQYYLPRGSIKLVLELGFGLELGLGLVFQLKLGLGLGYSSTTCPGDMIQLVKALDAGFGRMGIKLRAQVGDISYGCSSAPSIT